MSLLQSCFQFDPKPPSSREAILENVKTLIAMHKKGLLGGETMPEDSNPGLDRDSLDNYHYFTLPMALNYQRNSYKLWEAAKKTYEDKECRDVFVPSKSAAMGTVELKEKLTKYKVALQPNKHTEIWQRISHTIYEQLNNDIRQLFTINQYNIPKILDYVQKEYKKNFPYLSGSKICVYWLYVIEQYANAVYSGREALTIAPDTHVIQSSIKLGLVSDSVLDRSDMRDFVSLEWRNLLDETGLLPIDVHTPLWLWSRGGFISLQK